METGLGKSLGSRPQNRLYMSLEKRALVELGKARVRKGGNSNRGGEGHKLPSKKMEWGHRGEEGGRAFEEESQVPVGMQEKVTRGRNLARKRHAYRKQGGWELERGGGGD